MTYVPETYLMHHGVKGQKWGVRRYQNYDGTLTARGKQKLGYRSTSISGYVARKQNEKINKSFQTWKVEAAKRDNAIAAGKKATDALLAYERDRTNKDLKSDYKQKEKEYKKALRSNTTYRKGQVRGEVGHDRARKYLTEAKRAEKDFKKDPSNYSRYDDYTRYMNKHDKELAKARRAPEVAAKRSRTKASMKRAATMTVKVAATAAVTAGGLYLVNKYCLAGSGMTMAATNVETLKNAAKAGKKILSYMY